MPQMSIYRTVKSLGTDQATVVDKAGELMRDCVARQIDILECQTVNGKFILHLHDRLPQDFDLDYYEVELLNGQV